MKRIETGDFYVVRHPKGTDEQPENVAGPFVTLNRAQVVQSTYYQNDERFDHFYKAEAETVLIDEQTPTQTKKSFFQRLMNSFGWEIRRI